MALVHFDYKVTQVYIRVVYFLMSIYKIEVKGKIDEKTRAVFFNHVTVTDGPAVWMIKPFRCIIASGVKKVPFFGKVVQFTRCIFVERSKTEGQSQLIMDAMQDHNMDYIALAPEGKTTQGNYMLAFRTGGFLTNEQVQPIVLRYHSLSFGCTGFHWSVGFRQFLWRTFSCPYTKLTINILPPLNSEEYLKASAQERAKMAQLSMANALGLKAIDQTSKEYFNAKAKKE